MDKTDKIILVTGATGQQGGATARHLLAKGWPVRALSRYPDQPAAQALRLAGAEVVQGDIDNRASLEAATHGVYGVSSVQPHSDDEARQGKCVADVARDAGIQHFVYTSVGRAEDLSRVHVNVGKWEIEQYIQGLGLPATILRPAGFMDSLAHPLYGVTGDTLAIPIKPDAAYPLIAVSDIGIFAALAFDSPDAYLGKTIELIGDVPTPPQIAASISRATGRSITYVQVPIETLRQQNAELARACEFLNEGNFNVDISALRKLHPGLLDFDTWLQKEGKAQFEALRHE
jgi:uncharacterized protein YbjT (DUF2867 family)